MQPLAARCRLGLGLLHASAGKREQACRELAAARESFASMGIELWLVRTERALAES
ncbi:MAG TPA: hypothetical protein VE932_11550 [Patescibacteria group bacterium]|nr:hypothetical protein [Patescibacteria group bacterium]